MAEFQEVMRQWVRVRKATASSTEENVLSVYPLEEYDNGLIANIEKNVMAWAADHPEPVYPTWTEWLCEQGLVGCRPGLKNDEMEYCLTSKVFTPIPADLAQKLGIEPKAVNTAKLIFDLKNNPPKEG